MTFPARAFSPVKMAVALLCLYLAYVSASRGMADYWSEQSRRIALNWQDNAPTDETWRVASGSLARALELDDTNPTYNHRMGRLYHIRMILDPLHRSEWGRDAKRYYEKSLAVRPEWPLTWASYALVKADLGEYDDNLDRAILNAVRFGAWEPGVHQIIAAIGARGLRVFSGEVRSAVVANNVRGLMSPVSGSARAVIDRLGRYAGPDLAAMMPEMGSSLLAANWKDHRHNAYLDLAHVVFEFWPYFRPEQQAAMISRVMTVADDPGVMQLAAQYNRLSLVCPQMARGPLFDRFCSNRRLSFD